MFRSVQGNKLKVCEKRNPTCRCSGRLALSSYLLMDTRMQISGCGALKPSRCLKTPIVSSSCSLSGLWCSITSSGTQARHRPAQHKLYISGPILHCGSVFRQGKRQLVAEVWLSHGPCWEQGEDAQTWKQPFSMLIPMSIYLNFFILTFTGHRLGGCKGSHHQAGSYRQRPCIPPQTPGLLESL